MNTPLKKAIASTSLSIPGLKSTRSLLCATAVLLSAALPASAVIYDAKTDFSTTTNGGSNPWTYAAAITFGGTGNPETVFADISSGWGWAQNGWSGAGASWENWGIASASENLAQIEPGDFMTHGYTGVVFTATAAGTYQVDVSSWLGRDNGRTLLGKLMLNINEAVPLGQGFYTYASNSRATPFSVYSGEVTLSIGDTLRFDTVGWSAGPGSADFAGVNFTVQPVPEPTTVALVLGAAGLALLMRRRRPAL